jgi:hypothetical protein
MNKFSFINQLLQKEKFTASQKERVLKLVTKELARVEGNEKHILSEIELIKSRIGLQSKADESSAKNLGPKRGKQTLMPEDIGALLEGAKEPEILHDVLVKKHNTTSPEEGLQILLDNTIHKRKVEGGNDSSVNSKKSPEPNPKHVADFMSLFNQRNGLKYLTHDYDENSEFEIDKFLIDANKVFREETKKINIPTSLWAIVKQFAFDSKQTEWTSISEDYKKSIPNKIGWATKELRDWSKKKSRHPIRNKEYEKIINDFKRITRIESSNLEILIGANLENIFGNEIENFEVEKIDLKKADFYSHIGFLKIAFDTIFEEIKKRSDSSEKKKITIKYERSVSDDDYYLRKIIITHHKSFPAKELTVILKEWNEKGNMGKIKEKLRGYCHWSVETMIEDTPTRVNILKETETEEHELISLEKGEKLDGFNHILTFYYK